MKLSVVIPAYNEEENITKTVKLLSSKLLSANIPHEILVVNDNSKDGTERVLQELQKEISELVYVNNLPPNGFGFAVRKGLEFFSGDVVSLFMADASDTPDDLIRFYEKIKEGHDCVFGTRWSKGGKTYDYPKHKLFLNRLANWFIKTLFTFRYDDVTNAFKMYRREVIEGVQPLISYHFNLTVEIPLKAIIRGYSYTVVSNSWHNRTVGVSNLRIREMGSRYLFIVIYCFIEKWLSRGDYKRSIA